MTTIVLDQISQSYGTNQVVAPLSLTFSGPSINMLMGPSGCGKSTILRMLGGVRPQKVQTPTAGKVMIDNVLCTDQHDDAVTVFQTYSNRPDLTVRENMEWPFRLGLMKHWAKADVKNVIDKMLLAVGLEDKQNLYPKELSGGQNQRVALARALALRPKILLMDEPFGALDAYTRRGVQELLIGLYNQFPCLVVMITHDVGEAIALGDRIIMMAAKPGRVIHDQMLTANPGTVARSLNFAQPALEQQLIAMLRPTGT
jgi:ABC-type nitrate/sulfonate/bicarbonate transport system ATPase subunit